MLANVVERLLPLSLAGRRVCRSRGLAVAGESELDRQNLQQICDSVQVVLARCEFGLMNAVVAGSWRS